MIQHKHNKPFESLNQNLEYSHGTRNDATEDVIITKR